VRISRGAVRIWVRRTTGVRDVVATPGRETHRTTDAVPRARFETEERMQLQPLAARVYRPLLVPVDPIAGRTTTRSRTH